MIWSETRVWSTKWALGSIEAHPAGFRFARLRGASAFSFPSSIAESRTDDSEPPQVSFSLLQSLMGVKRPFAVLRLDYGCEPPLE